MEISVLCVDDEIESHEFVDKILRSWERAYSINHAYSPKEALDILGSKPVHIAIVDLNYSGELLGLDLVKQIRDKDKAVEIIVASSSQQFEHVQKAMQNGANDYLLKGFGRGEFLHAMERALERKQWKQIEKKFIQQNFKLNDQYKIIGNSIGIKKLKQMMERVANSDLPILITAETGSGKELVARGIYNLKNDFTRSFVAVDCGAIPTGTADSFFFGHEKGAFTGADSAKEGVFEECDGGVLFLDEINSLSLDLQSKLLRVLQDKEFRKVGGKKTKKTDFQLVCASNKDLEELVTKGLFRQDLLFRVNAIRLNIPSLRERKEDISDLLSFFLPHREFSKEVLDLFNDYQWPGNIRELKNTVEAMNIMALPNEILSLTHLPEHFLKNISISSEDFEKDPDELAPTSLKILQEMQEREFLSRAYRSAAGNISRMSRVLKQDRSHLHQKLVKLGIHQVRA